jgi:hypothetical protein
MSIRREPFRLFFPLAIALAVAGFTPWLLFALGLQTTWPGNAHAGLLSRGFALAVVTGFLGTMIPRRAQASPMSLLELALFAGGIGIVIPASLAGAPVVVAAAGLAVELTLIAFVGRRLVRRAPGTTIPPSFAFVPVALLLGGAADGIALGGALAGRPYVAFATRALVVDGLAGGLVLAIAPMITPMICDGAPPLRAGVDRSRARFAALAGLFAVAAVAETGALLAGAPSWLVVAARIARAFVVAWVVFVECGALRRPRLPGLYRRLVRIALTLFAIGATAGALTSSPSLRLALLHLGWIGGLLLLALAVSVHVVLHHGGREAEATATPGVLAVASALVVAAALVRAAAPLLPRAGVAEPTAYASAALLAVVAATLWLAYLGARLRPPRAEPPDRRSSRGAKMGR